MPSHFVRTQERILRELDAIYSSIIFLCLVCLLFIYIKSTRSSPLIYRGSNFTILRVTYKYDDEERAGGGWSGGGAEESRSFENSGSQSGGD